MNKVLRLCIPLLVALFLLGAGFLLVDASAASSQTGAALQSSLLVTTLEDELNTDGDCSLREAIQAANTNTAIDACGSGDVLTDTITFSVAGTITLTGHLSVNTGGPLLIDGAGEVTLSGGDNVRVFFVNSGAELALQNLTITRGYAATGDGGGIYNAGTLTITGSTLSGNIAFYGGGIFNEGTLTIANSTLSGNTANADGGGIYNDYGMLTIAYSTLSDNSALDDGSGISNSRGTLTITSSTLSGNSATWYGGGIYNYSGTLTITSSTLSGNYAYWGGGIINWGTLTITDSTLSGNTAAYGGGGIFNEDMLTIMDSTLSGNTANEDGGGVHNSGTLTINSSTFSDNSTLYGGGIYNYNSGILNISNSTLSGNSAAYGGGIDNAGTLTITSSTLSGNSAAAGGGGIYNYDGTLTITNSIVANSPSGGDCWAYPAITDGGHNLSSDVTCGFDWLPNIDPLLGPLQDNGGPTLTHALLFGSPAIDAGDDIQCPATDQRGFPRPVDGDGDGTPVCDIGSYEYQVAPTLLTITGAVEGFIQQSYSFTATVEPLSTTLPLTYTWQVDGQLPITHTSGLTATVSFTWELTGTYVITLTASNLSDSVSDIHEITILVPGSHTYLPLVVKD